jgi:hypothetical protein
MLFLVVPASSAKSMRLLKEALKKFLAWEKIKQA